MVKLMDMSYVPKDGRDGPWLQLSSEVLRIAVLFQSASGVEVANYNLGSCYGVWCTVLSTARVLEPPRLVYIEAYEQRRAMLNTFNGVYDYTRDSYNIIFYEQDGTMLFDDGSMISSDLPRAFALHVRRATRHVVAYDAETIGAAGTKPIRLAFPLAIGGSYPLATCALLAYLNPNVFVAFLYDDYVDSFWLSNDNEPFIDELYGRIEEKMPSSFLSRMWPNASTDEGEFIVAARQGYSETCSSAQMTIFNATLNDTTSTIECVANLASFPLNETAYGVPRGNGVGSDWTLFVYRLGAAKHLRTLLWRTESAKTPSGLAIETKLYYSHSVKDLFESWQVKQSEMKFVLLYQEIVNDGGDTGGGDDNSGGNGNTKNNENQQTESSSSFGNQNTVYIIVIVCVVSVLFITLLILVLIVVKKRRQNDRRQRTRRSSAVVSSRSSAIVASDRSSHIIAGQSSHGHASRRPSTRQLSRRPSNAAVVARSNRTSRTFI